MDEKSFNLGSCDVEAFCAVVDRGETEKHIQVPVDKFAKKAFVATLKRTAAALDQERGDGKWAPFEVSENPKGTTAVMADLRDEMFRLVARVVDMTGRKMGAAEFRERSDEMRYYYVVFIDEKGRRLVGFKQARGIKAGLRATHIWLRETLEVVPEPTFRLDETFDFLADRKAAYVLHASALEAIAEVKEFIVEKYKERAKGLSKEVPAVDWKEVAAYADSKPRAQRLIIALSRRDDIRELDARAVKKLLNDCGAEYTVQDGVFCPKARSEIKFLEALDGRRWLHNISGKHPYRYKASNRTVDG